MAEHHHHHHHYYHEAGRSNGQGSPNPHRLYRSQDRILGGVCGGIAEYFGWRPWLVRLAALVLLMMVTPPVLISYLLAWFWLKERPRLQPQITPEEERFWRNVSTKPKVTMSELRHKFRGLEGRLADMERVVTSEEYKLKRAFRDLEGA